MEDAHKDPYTFHEGSILNILEYITQKERELYNIIKKVIPNSRFNTTPEFDLEHVLWIQELRIAELFYPDKENEDPKPFKTWASDINKQIQFYNARIRFYE